ncbi:MAG: Gfo/Idh/MocA family oxidoreductase [Armatimonadota bacterium]|nr:Gfo/Idh/MocA family oxidoreductase [Armatimonadota bacterium]
MDRVRIGIIGVGGMGSAHARMMQQIEEVQLTAVADIDSTVAQQVAEQYGVPFFTDYRQCIDSGLVDAVLVATPHPSHPEIAIYAFDRGLHVLCEKPMAIHPADADQMIEAARRAGKVFSIMFQMRTERAYRIARKAIEQGVVGEVMRTQLVSAWYRNQAYYDSAEWRATWAGEGGGVLVNQAPHLLDMFCWLAGLPAKVTAFTHTRLHDIETEDEAFALLEYSNGAHGYLYTTTNEAPGTQRIEIAGDLGKVVVQDGQVSVYRLQTPLREFTHTSTDMWAGPQAEPVQVEVEEMPTGHAHITRNFARAILYGEPLLAPGEEGIWNVELASAIILSSKRGKTVSLPVDRAEYDALLQELRASSQPKRRVIGQRVSDPNIVR